MDLLKKQMTAVYKKKKKSASGLGTGSDIHKPPFYIKSPDPVAKSIGHYPGQRIVQISGKPNSGKTTLGMLAMVEAQKGYFNEDLEYVESDEVVILFVDTEKKFSMKRFAKMGGDPERIFKISCTSLEQAFFGIFQTLDVVYAQKPDAKVLLVFDSIGGTPSEAEANAEADESIQLATAAKVIKRNLRILVTRFFDDKDITGVFINTNYANIGSHGRSNHGGDGLEYASAAIVQLSRTGDITEERGGMVVSTGINSRLNVTKNHLQTKDVAVKRVDFKVFAYEVEMESVFKIKRDARFKNESGLLVVQKSSPKKNEVTYYYEDKDGEMTEPEIGSMEAVLEILENGDYSPVL